MILAFLGCLFIGDAEHAERLADARARFDTGSETGGDALQLPDGVYEGGFSVTVMGALGEDTCEGQTTLVVSTADTPAVRGEVYCEYSGAYAVHGAQTGTLTGNLASDSATGTLVFGSGVEWVDTWAGSTDVGPPARISAAFGGTTSCSGTSCDYAGLFSADRL